MRRTELNSFVLHARHYRHCIHTLDNLMRLPEVVNFGTFVANFMPKLSAFCDPFQIKSRSGAQRSVAAFIKWSFALVRNFECQWRLGATSGFGATATLVRLEGA